MKANTLYMLAGLGLVALIGYKFYERNKRYRLAEERFAEKQLENKT